MALGLRTRSKELASDYREIERARLHESRSREFTIGELRRRELEAIVRGRGPGFSHDERAAAFDVLNRIEQLRPGERILVRADMHRTLADRNEIKERVREASERQRVLARERSRYQGRGRGLQEKKCSDTSLCDM